MSAREDRGAASGRAVTGPDARLLADVVTRLRRALRTSIRTDYPWETLPMAQVEILQRLREEPGLRLHDVAQRQRLANNTVSAVVQRMVVAGLVARLVDERDRRAVHLTLTPSGEQVLDGWQRAHERRFATALDRLDASQRTAVVEALPALAALVEQLTVADGEDEPASSGSQRSTAATRRAAPPGQDGAQGPRAGGRRTRRVGR